MNLREALSTSKISVRASSIEYVAYLSASPSIPTSGTCTVFCNTSCIYVYKNASPSFICNAILSRVLAAGGSLIICTHVLYQVVTFDSKFYT